MEEGKNRINIREIFKKWSEVLVETEEDLMKEFEERFEKSKKEKPDLFKDDEERKKYILMWMKGLYQRQFRSPALKFEGIFLGYSDVFDPNIKERQIALSEGAVDENGNPIFCSETVPDWKKGRPIPENERMRTYIGVAKPIENSEQQDYKPFILYFRSEKIEPPKAPLLKKVLFRANVGSSGLNGEIMMLSGSDVATGFNVINSNDVDFKEITKKYFNKYIYKLTEDNIINAVQTNTRFFVTRGIVARINLTSDTQRSNVIELVPEDDSFDLDVEKGNIVLFVNKDLEIDFGEGSRIYVIGTPGVDNNNRVNIGVLGLWCDPELRIAPEVPPKKINEQGLELKDNDKKQSEEQISTKKEEQLPKEELEKEWE